jgi:predicted permease
MLADLRYALRGFGRSPGFTLAAVLSLALGIGANTAIFSLVNAVLLRALPVRDPDRLVTFSLKPPSQFSGSAITTNAFRQIREKNTVLDGFVATMGPSLRLTIGDSIEDVHSNAVSGNFFQTLGVGALIGRVLTPDDDRVEAPPVCVIGYGFWVRRFAGDPTVIGRKVVINDQLFTIVGVTPKQFAGLDTYEATDITVPMATIPQTFVNAFGRLKRGVSARQAQASLDVLYHQVETGTYRYSDHARLSDLKVTLEPGGRGVSVLRGQYQNPLLMLMAVVGLVLLIACANVVNLLMARMSGRAREIAVRLALGGGRGRLIRQLLAESLLLTFGGATLGVALAIWTDHALRSLAPWQIGTPIPPEVDVNPDWRVLLFTLAIAILVSTATGLLPAIPSTRPNVAPALKGEAGVRAPGRFSFANALIVAQTALSLVLLIGGGLFLRSLHNLRAIDPGFDPSHLILATIEPARRGYSIAASQRYIGELTERARRLPGVVAVSPGLISPLSGDFAMARVKVPGYVPFPGEMAAISINFVGANYFKTLGTPLLAGRLFTDEDGIVNKVAIVNERAAKHYWPQENPIGKHITTGLRDLFDCEVVGIVRDIKTQSLRSDAQAIIYVPTALNTMGHVTLHVRVAGDPSPVISALRQEIHTLDRNLQARDITTMAAQIDRTIALDRLLALLTALFALLAVALASVGLYGVMAFTVAARTREIGIRMALGANRGRVLLHVLSTSALLTLLGIAIGVPAALWVTRAVGSQLYGLSPSDPPTYAALAVALGTVALSAAWLPARRAAGVDPMVALRYE